MTQTAVKPQGDAARTALVARHDIYAGAHKGLRSFMADTLVAAGRMDAYDPAETIGTLAQLRELLALCRAHLHAENQFLHPAMEARRPGSAGESAKEHEDQVQAMEELETDVLRARRGTLPVSRAATTTDTPVWMNAACSASSRGSPGALIARRCRA
jgi:hypothetical protein